MCQLRVARVDYIYISSVQFPSTSTVRRVSGVDSGKRKAGPFIRLTTLVLNSPLRPVGELCKDRTILRFI
jgi:hypothetical protein